MSSEQTSGLHADEAVLHNIDPADTVLSTVGKGQQEQQQRQENKDALLVSYLVRQLAVCYRINSYYDNLLVRSNY